MGTGSPEKQTEAWYTFGDIAELSARKFDSFRFVTYRIEVDVVAEIPSCLDVWNLHGVAYRLHVRRRQTRHRTKDRCHSVLHLSTHCKKTHAMNKAARASRPRGHLCSSGGGGVLRLQRQRWQQQSQWQGDTSGRATEKTPKIRSHSTAAQSSKNCSHAHKRGPCMEDNFTCPSLVWQIQIIQNDSIKAQNGWIVMIASINTGQN